MHLFLTSSPCDDHVPHGVELPCIFDERNGFVERLVARVPQDARLLVIASDPDDYDLNDEMAETFVGCFEYHGMMLSSVNLCDGRTEEQIAEMVAESDIILLGGGHVPTQNRFFQRMGLKWLLKDYPGVVIGISAGSMNCASVVYAQPEWPGESLDPYYVRFLSGLGLTDIMILPHYQKVRDMMLDGRRLYEDITYADSFGRCFIAMVDGSYVLCEDGRSLLCGEGYLVSDGKLTPICGEEECLKL